MYPNRDILGKRNDVKEDVQQKLSHMESETTPDENEQKYMCSCTVLHKNLKKVEDAVLSGPTPVRDARCRCFASDS